MEHRMEHTIVIIYRNTYRTFAWTELFDLIKV